MAASFERVDEDVRVSVAIITYNQQSTVGQAVDSVLAQRGAADSEIVVTDDASTDSTGDVLRELQAAHPDRIRLTIRSTNVGFQRNFFDTLAACRGRYIALLEGDDYWIDGRKLERQVEVLESEPDLGGVFHDAWIEDTATGSRRLRIGERDIERTVGPTSLLLENNIATASMVFRNGLRWDELPDWLYEAPVADYPLALLISEVGPWRYLPEVMSVYRSHGDGVWGGLSLEKQRRTQRRLLDLLEANWQGAPLDRAIRVKRRMLHRKDAIEEARRGRVVPALRHLTRSGPAVWSGYPKVSLRKFVGALRLGLSRRRGN